MALNTYLSILTLNVHGLNAPTKRYKAAGWMRKQDPVYMLPPRDPSQIKRYTQTKSKRMEKNISCKWKGKKPGVSVLISNKIDFKSKVILKDKEGHYIMIKGTIQQEGITLVNMYIPNIGEPNYVNQILLNIKGEMDRNTVIVRDFNTPLTSMDRSSREKIKRETVTLNDTIDQIDLIDILRAFHPKAIQYTYFSSAHGMFSRIHHMLGHKRSLNKFKKIEIIPSIFSDHNTMKLEINHKKNTGKHAKTWELN